MNTPRGLVEMGRGGACVSARVAPQGRIHHPFPAHNACVFGMETPLCGRSGGHTGTAPTVSFGWIALALRVSFGWVMRANALNPRGRMVVGRIKPVGLVLLIAQGWRRKEPTLRKGGGRKSMPSALYFL